MHKELNNELIVTHQPFLPKKQLLLKLVRIPNAEHFFPIK